MAVTDVARGPLTCRETVSGPTRRTIRCPERVDSLSGGWGSTLGRAVLLGDSAPATRRASERWVTTAARAAGVSLAAHGATNPWMGDSFSVVSAANHGEKCGLRNLFVSLPG